VRTRTARRRHGAGPAGGRRTACLFPFDTCASTFAAPP